MAKGSDIVNRLVNIVPKLTNLFSDNVAISSLSRSGSTVTAITAAAHGLSTGNYVNIVGAEAPVQIINLTRTGNIASAQTNDPHDLTYGWQQTIKVVGADQPEYNGNALPLLSVPNRFNFTYQISGTPVSPATGTILLSDKRERGYNGSQQVTVIDATTFTYAIDGAPYTPPIGTVYAQKNTRIAGAVSIDRVLDAYTKQGVNSLWAFVVLGDTSVNKDRMVYNNSNYTPTPGTAFQQMEIQQISVFVVVPCTNEIAARAARDLMEDVRTIFYKALLNFSLPTGLVSPGQFGIAFAGHRISSYDTAFYVHEFLFQVCANITADDLLIDDNVAFRDIDFTITNSPDELITNEVNLDDYPV